MQINKRFAKNYNNWRSKEEYQKLKDKYGNDYRDIEKNNDESTESEEDLAEYITPEFENQWLQTLTALKKKDPKIYDKNVQFFKEIKTGGDVKKKHFKEKKFTLKDYERKVVLERNGQYDSDSDSKNLLTYDNEQKYIKNSLKNIIDDNIPSDDEELFIKKKSVCEDLDNNFIIKKDSTIKNELIDKETFLKSYLLSDNWRESDNDNVDISDENLSEEEEQLAKEEEFEKKFNFRHEETNSSTIQSFSRKIEDSLRIKNTKRIEKRAKLNERKKGEKQKKIQELKQLKKFKKMQIENKIIKLYKASGAEKSDEFFNIEDLEADFDQESHDKKMKKLFNEDFYRISENKEKSEILKISDDESDYEEDWDNYVTTNKSKINENNYKKVNNVNDKIISKTGKKHRSIFFNFVEQQKPMFNPDEKTFDEYVNEYYSLDFEDVVNDIPCRFKYRPTVPNNFGLTTEDILKADDNELNKWIGVRRMSQYRTEEDEIYDKKKYNKKKSRKTNIITSLIKDVKNKNLEFDNKKESISKSAKKNRKRKERKKLKMAENSDPIIDIKKNDEDILIKKKQKIKKKKQIAIENRKRKGLTDERLAAYGLDTKKMKL